MTHRISIHRIKAEIQVKTSRSSGPGGQHVNKTESRVQLIFNIRESAILEDQEKETLLAFFKSQLTNEGAIIVACESNRSQLKNKEAAFKKLDRMLAKAFAKKKKRKPTSPSKAAKQKRLKSKKIQSEKKQQRGKIDF
ncbi:alternative ribosome rescue aminoacyl-tRNA hydrolase ArfB [Fulvivirga sedimenti]|uniref:Aminoacyl-tRNA hydrolase n=1 Tax=Fulvivirga sedimenti TaxID=2879465 RepID=A0A9X1KV51_9BACT|nr:alternative ribosome rescue aminoacyl-tRNA hydrolase ArfB [Fulvivirga sedimenti]MCA6074328.1 aminoacyl-tRNA hydrolase [Fulvivirga sedimenti]